MSLYNMANGFNPACILFLPMLGRYYKDYPRFRDCFLKKDEDGQYVISVLTRVGGPNRNNGYGEEEIMKDPNFIRTYDYDRDDTYGFYEFKIPDEYKKDAEFIISRQLNKVSSKYVKVIKDTYPSMENLINKLFKK